MLSGRWAGPLLGGPGVVGRATIAPMTANDVRLDSAFADLKKTVSEKAATASSADETLDWVRVAVCLGDDACLAEAPSWVQGAAQRVAMAGGKGDLAGLARDAATVAEAYRLLRDAE